MEFDDSPALIQVQLDRLLAATERHLQTIKQLSLDHHRNAGFSTVERDRVVGSDEFSDALTSHDESLASGRTYQAYVDEQVRIGQEYDRIAAEVKPHLLRQVWRMVPYLEIDYPTGGGFELKYRDLLGEIPDDPTEVAWVTNFLLKLRTLLSDSRDRAFGDRGSTPITASEPGFTSRLVVTPKPAIEPAGDAAGGFQQSRKRWRGPNLEMSRERLALLDRLVSELTTIHQQRYKAGSVEGLKKKYPDFKLWTLLPDGEHQELFSEFKPKGFAANLVLRKFGLTSLESLKADRRKLKASQS